MNEPTAEGIPLEDDEDSDEVVLGVGYAGREARGGKAQRMRTPEEAVDEGGGEEEAAAAVEASPEPENSGAEGMEEEEEQGIGEEWQVCAGDAWEEGDLLIEEADDADLLHSRWREQLAAHLTRAPSTALPLPPSPSTVCWLTHPPLALPPVTMRLPP